MANITNVLFVVVLTGKAIVLIGSVSTVGNVIAKAEFRNAVVAGYAFEFLG